MGNELQLRLVFNLYSKILLQRARNADCNAGELSRLAIRFFRDLLVRICARLKKQDLAEHFMLIFEFFKECFDFTGVFFRSHEGRDIPLVEEVEQSLVQAFQELAVKLTDEQLGRIVVATVKWSKSCKKIKNKESGKDDDRDLLGFNLHRQTIFNRIMCGLLDKLREFAVPYLQYQLPVLSEVLKTLV